MTTEWQAAPASPVLDSGAIHVWRVSLLLPAERITAFRSILSADELDRADRFRFRTHRNRYIGARGALRMVLGTYRRARPESLRFAYSSYGKPHLIDGRTLSFNVSHSEDIALVAVGTAEFLGVDIERMRPDRELGKLARRFFSTEEADMVLSLDGDAMVPAFYHCWTRKEAFIKAVGEGLSYALDRFAVTMMPAEPARLLHIDGDVDAAARWSLYDISAGPGFAAAVAFNNTASGVVCYDFAL